MIYLTERKMFEILQMSAIVAGSYTFFLILPLLEFLQLVRARSRLRMSSLFNPWLACILGYVDPDIESSMRVNVPLLFFYIKKCISSPVLSASAQQQFWIDTALPGYPSLFFYQILKIKFCLSIFRSGNFFAIYLFISIYFHEENVDIIQKIE